MRKVAIEKTLTNVKRYLEDNNFTVEVLESGNKESTRALNKYDAIVVTGADENLMGIQNALTNTQIVNAQGKTAEDVYTEIMNRIK